MTLGRGAWMVGCVAALHAALSLGAERQVTTARVPPDKLAEVRALTNPLPASAENVAKGKALYMGKGTCVNCHGPNGKGDGPVASAVDPSPRNFHDPEFWRSRTDGELFWVMKHGSAGTSMIGFADQLSDADIWSIVHYLHTFH